MITTLTRPERKELRALIRAIVRAEVAKHLGQLCAPPAQTPRKPRGGAA